MVTTAIEAAKDWLKSAELNLNAGMPAQSLYSLEMAVEIAFKAVLISLDIEVPKVHDIEKTIRAHIAVDGRMPKWFLDELEDYLSTFGTLLELRMPAGYVFEQGFKKEGIEQEAKMLIPKCRKILQSCEKVVKAIDKVMK
jgi:HEPN domain-containing protein